MIFWQITALLEKYEATLKTPVKDLPEDAIDEILRLGRAYQDKEFTDRHLFRLFCDV